MRLKVFGFFLAINLLIGLSYMSLQQTEGQTLLASAAAPEIELELVAAEVEDFSNHPTASVSIPMDGVSQSNEGEASAYQITVRNWDAKYQELYKEQVEAIHQLMSVLPTQFTQELKIILDYGDAYRALGGSNFVIIGANKVKTMDEFVALLAHEIGHCVHDQLNPKEQKLPSHYSGVDNTSPALAFYNISWEKEGQARTGEELEFISEYAQTNHYEDFAETFGAYIVMGPEFRVMVEENGVMAQKYAYMKNLFEGKEFEGVLGEVDLEDRPWDMTKETHNWEALIAMNNPL